MKYKCIHCNKHYSSYQSRCNHIRRYHKVEISPELVKPEVDVSQKLVKNSLKCNFCDKTYKHRSSKSKHEKSCKEIVDSDKNDEIDKMKIEMAEYKAEMEKLKDIIQKSLKIHPKTLLGAFFYEHE